MRLTRVLYQPEYSLHIIIFPLKNYLSEMYVRVYLLLINNILDDWKENQNEKVTILRTIIFKLKTFTSDMNWY